MSGLVLGVLLIMTSMCGYTWPDSLDAIIREEAVRNDVPLDLAYTFIAAESGFDPTARNLTATEDSVGLLQLNRIGGQGQGYSVQELMDPRRNLQIGLPYIAAAFRQTWSPTIPPFEFIYLVSIRSGHPGQVPRDDYRILRIARIWTCFFPAAGVSGPLGAPSTVAGPGPAVALGAGIPALFMFLLFPAGIIRAMLPSLAVHQRLRTAALGITPGGIVHRLQQSLDPSYVLMDPLTFFLPRPRTRLPPRHRFPRRMR